MISRHANAWSLLALGALLIAPLAEAAGCAEGCGQKLARCSSACGVEPKCSRRCNDQFDSCSDNCLRTEKPKQAPAPAKCTGRNGKMTSCNDYLAKPAPLQPYTQQQQEQMAKEYQRQAEKQQAPK